MCEISGEAVGNIYLYLQVNAFLQKRKEPEGESSYASLKKKLLQHKIASVYLAPYFIQNMIYI